MPTIIPREERELILNSFDLIPDPVWKTYCDTNDRKKQWEVCQYWSNLLQAAFEAYFSGQPLELETDDKDFRNIFNLKFRRYLKIYDVVWHSWKHIANLASTVQEILILSELQNYKYPNSPGEMLIAIIKLENLGLLARLFPEWRSGNYYDSFSARRSYERNRQYSKLKSKFINNNIRPPELKQLQKLLNQKEKDYRENFIFSFYTIICLDTARKHCQKGSNIERSLDEIEEIHDDLNKLKLKTLHPRSKMPGYSVNKGVRGKAI